MGRRADIPPELRTRPFLVEEALTLGVSRRVLEGTWCRAPFRSVRVPADLGDSLLIDCWALSLLVPGAAFSGLTALRLSDVPVTGSGTRLQVSVTRAANVPRIRGLTVRRDLDPRRVRRLEHGVPVFGPLDSWLRLGATLPRDDLVVAGDALVRRRRWTDLDHLRCRAADLRGVAGVRRVRQAAALVRDGADSPPETLLRMALLRAGLPEPVLQLMLRDRWGEYLARPDVAWPQFKIAIEYDGGHHRDRGQWLSDVRRGRGLTDAGWRVYVATSADLRSGFRECVRWAERELRRSGW